MFIKDKFKHLEIQLQAIKSATENFAESHRIGEGGFGVVFKGKLLQLNGHIMVACKRLDTSGGQGEPEFWKEVMTLSLYQHVNIVSLLGFCDEKGVKGLVYEYASKGSLDSHLKSKDLTWVQRLKICIGAARGLEFLHNPPGNPQRVIHRDIKSANILLDKDWNAMIADFGLSIRVPIKQEYSFFISNACGSIGYCDPLFAETDFLTKESDVYSFGVVLFEVLCGRLCIDNKGDHRRLTELIQNCYNNLDDVIYDGIKDEINPTSLHEFIAIAYQCLRREREERPLMDDVVRKLERALKYQLEPVEVRPEDIISATNDFAESNYIGERNFGTVFKGKLVLWKGPTMVTLQRLGRAFKQDNLEKCKDIVMLSGYRHENIISLLGFCDMNGDKILVQEHAPNGGLALYLSSNHLGWVQRLKICIGVARGLAYLHNPGWTQQRLLHRDISSDNILLDENWNAKIANIGLSTFQQSYSDSTYLITDNNFGTLGYLDPQYWETGLFTKETDVYALGVVLFEVLCGRLCISENHTHRNLTRLVRSSYKRNKINEIIYGDIKDEIHPDSLKAFTTIAYQCLKRDYEERPLAKEIVTTLETALEYQVRSPSSNSTNASPPLHWEKTCATVGSLWAVSHKQGKQSRAPTIDITELDSLFCKPGSEKLKLDDIDLVDLDIASNLQIMIRNINIPRSDIINAILALDSSVVTVDQADELIKLCPTKEEMETLMSFTGDAEMLGQREQFVLNCAKIPRIKSKLRVFAFIVTFSRQVNYLTDTLNIIKDATKEIRESTKLVKIMQIILMMGNKLNAGTVGGSAIGFKLDSLEKLGDTYPTETTDQGITLLHFLCKVIADQTPELLDFDKDLIHLQAAYVVNFAIVGGFEQVQQEFHALANEGGVFVHFRESLKCFIDGAGAQLRTLTSLFDEVDQYADSLAVYFAEDPNRCPWEQVISSLVRFIVKFKKAHSENIRRADTEKKKLKENVVEEENAKKNQPEENAVEEGTVSNYIKRFNQLLQ